MARFKILAFAASVSLSLLANFNAAAAEPGAPAAASLTILHTNDIHGHLTAWRGWEGELAGKTIGGMDRLGTAVKGVRKSVGANKVILLDAGDTLGDTMIADETKGKAILEVMNALRYDAMVIGNHEVDFTADTLKQRIAEAKFPVLGANIREKASGRPFAQPYIIKEVNTLKVGILGIAYPNTALTTAKKNVLGLAFLDAPATASKFVPEMKKQGAQIVIVLSHYGLTADKKLAQQVSGIDVIVGGHSHNRMSTAMREGNTLIVQAGAHGSDLGRLDLTIVKGKIVGHKRSLITLDNAFISSDPEIARLISDTLTPHKAKLTESVGTASSNITRAQTIGDQEPGKRDQESPADSLFADIIREETQSDVVILPGVGYGTAIHPGSITAEDLRNLIPHESKVVSMRLNQKRVRLGLLCYCDLKNKKIFPQRPLLRALLF